MSEHSGSTESLTSCRRVNISRPRLYQKFQMFRLINVVLSVMLGFLCLLLLLSLLPRSNMSRRSCFSPGPGSHCFWPFGSRNSLLLISMDGFRHDYLELVRERLGADSLPNFARLEASGVRAHRSINAFPTVTLPNHQTLLTGLYPQEHGIVGNDVRDMRFPDTTLSMDNQTSLNEAPWLNDWPEPIWVTLQKSGGVAASVLWPLTDQPVRDDLPFQQVSEYILLNSHSSQYPYKKRISDLLWWLDNPRYQVDLVLAYFDEPDVTGHAYGPTSLEVALKVRELDTILGWLIDGMEKHGLSNRVDIILTADHGMASNSMERVIVLDEFVNATDYTYTFLSTVGFLYPTPGKDEEVYEKLRNAHKHLQVYWLRDVPQYLYFNKNTSRMPPIVLLSDPNWLIVQHRTSYVNPGNHGYSTNFSDMHPFLIASGPSFRVNTTVDEVHAVDIYPLACQLLRFRPLPNNGSLNRIAEVLLKPDVAARLLAFDYWPKWFFWLAIEVELLWIIFTGILSLCLVTALLFSIRMQHKYARIAFQSNEDLVEPEVL